MGFSSYAAALKHYRGVQAGGNVEDASPHRLICLLLDRALEHLQQADGAIVRRDINQKCRHLNDAVLILGGLRQSLDFETGGELARNLDALYEYMSLKLTEAVRGGERNKIAEVMELLREIQMAWVQVPQLLTAHASA